MIVTVCLLLYSFLVLLVLFLIKPTLTFYMQLDDEQFNDEKLFLLKQIQELQTSK